MQTGRVIIAPGVLIEDFGSHLLVMVPGSGDVLTLSGASADLVRDLQQGSLISIGACGSELLRRGILKPAGISRRSLLAAGTITATAGIGVLSLPAAAASSSETYDLLGYWGAVTEDDEDLTVVGVNFSLDSENKLVSPSLLLEGATASLIGEETDWAAYDALFGVTTGLTGFSYSFGSIYPRLEARPAPRETELDPDDAVFRALVQQLTNGTARGAVYGTLTAGGATFRVKFDYLG